MAIRSVHQEVLSQFWATFSRYTFELLKKNGQWQQQKRAVFDRGNGVGVLLYNVERRSVLLVRQFRLPAYLQQSPPDGYLLEVCAGKMDKEDEDPADAMRREILEETGYQVGEMKKVLEGFVSPGAVTELLYLYLAEYNDAMKIAEGGGLASEQEELEIIEMPFDEAWAMLERFEIIDCKTIMLLQQAKIQNIFPTPQQ